jgi:hypothetical protein
MAKRACVAIVVATVSATGCGVGTEDGVTYYRDIKPLVDQRCGGCHVAGGIASFPLNTYEDVYDVRTLVKDAVVARTMPPWLAADGCAEYANDRSLSDEQITMIAEWVDAGALAGDPRKEPDPLPDMNTELQRVDVTVEYPEAYTPGLSPDDYRCFPADWPYDEVAYVTGWSVEPGNPEIVHHVIAWLGAPSQAADVEREDRNDEGPGYQCFGDGGVWPELPLDENSIWLGAWAPGERAQIFPAGTGLKVKPGSKIVLQVHYNTLASEAVEDHTRMYFQVEREVPQPAVMLPWLSPFWFDGGMRIPAGQPDVKHSFAFNPSLVVGAPLQIFMPMLHMHQLGKSGRLSIFRGGKRDQETCLLDIDRWDFDWQLSYPLAEPIMLNRGDELNIECHWDNTPENQPRINGEPLPVREVNWGEGTRDEMCLGVFYLAKPVSSDPGTTP